MLSRFRNCISFSFKGGDSSPSFSYISRRLRLRSHLSIISNNTFEGMYKMKFIFLELSLQYVLLPLSSLLNHSTNDVCYTLHKLSTMFVQLQCSCTILYYEFLAYIPQYSKVFSPKLTTPLLLLNKVEYAVLVISNMRAIVLRFYVPSVWIIWLCKTCR